MSLQFWHLWRRLNVSNVKIYDWELSCYEAALSTLWLNCFYILIILKAVNIISINQIFYRCVYKVPTYLLIYLFALRPGVLTYFCILNVTIINNCSFLVFKWVTTVKFYLSFIVFYRCETSMNYLSIWKQNSGSRGENKRPRLRGIKWPIRNGRKRRKEFH